MALDLSNQAYQPVNIGAGFSEAFSRGAGAVPDLSARVGELLGVAMSQRGASERTAMEQQGGIQKELLSQSGKANETQVKMSALAAGMGSGLSATMQKMKAEKTFDIMGQIESNKIKKAQIAKAFSTLDQIPTGIAGRAQTWIENKFGQNTEALRDWQNLRSILMDATLLNTAKTKGAISDSEMALFMEAAAADDIVSIARVKPVLNKLINFMDAEETAGLKAYKSVFGEEFPAAGTGTGLPKPSAVDEDDWNMLSSAGKQAYYEMMGEEE